MTKISWRQAFRLSIVGYASWLGMMAIHESGHAIAGWLTGGRVRRVVLPLWGFSRTDVSPNPRRALEVWAGPLWGMAIPCLVWLAIARSGRKAWPTWKFFAGFCLVANGTYLAAGWAATAGDPWELERLGTPPWVMTVVGGAATAGGLFVWHRLGQRGREPTHE